MSTAPGAGLVLSGLTVELGGLRVLHDVHADVPAGCLTVLIGPNGAGKSTLLRAAAGLLPAAAASSVSFGGVPIHSLTPVARARLLAWVPDHADIPFAYTVLETVVMGRFPWHGGAPRAADLTAARAAIARVGMAAFAGRKVTALSSGERQKALVARALAGDAPCLLLDEPCANLDVGAALRLLGLLRELAALGKCVCVSLHDIALAHRFGDRAVCLAGGRIAAAGAPAAVFVPSVLDPVFGVRTTVLAGEGGALGLRFEAP